MGKPTPTPDQSHLPSGDEDEGDEEENEEEAEDEGKGDEESEKKGAGGDEDEEKKDKDKTIVLSMPGGETFITDVLAETENEGEEIRYALGGEDKSKAMLVGQEIGNKLVLQKPADAKVQSEYHFTITALTKSGTSTTIELTVTVVGVVAFVKPENPAITILEHTAIVSDVLAQHDDESEFKYSISDDS